MKKITLLLVIVAMAFLFTQESPSQIPAPLVSLQQQSLALELQIRSNNLASILAQVNLILDDSTQVAIIVAINKTLTDNGYPGLIRPVAEPVIEDETIPDE